MVRPLLEISRFKMYFHTDKGVVKAVDDVDLTVNEGEVVGLVGESGCGKSVTSLSVMGLVPRPPGRVEGGSIRLADRELTHLKGREWRKIRGNVVSMIFQEPMTSLNPVFTIGDQIVEAIRQHRKLDKKAARRLAADSLQEVGISRKGILEEYPHQLSGGMRQRVMIAMAMVCRPKLLIADEPTTALDVTIQAQILDLMRRLNRETGTAILMITHDLGVVAEMCDRVVVMYAGQVVEEADVNTLFNQPRHPYTQGLLQSIPRLGQRAERLYSIPGNVPNPKQMPTGCRFAPRCEYAMNICRTEEPGLFAIGDGQNSRCWLHVDKKEEADRDPTTTTS
ncbi:MAG: ABC transporter ATP-binding protein [Firmicutes bacterium]|uniref:Oligopeptide/dipeptide ABC transporter, ATP-binding protein, C-terminal domain-containing protein n=1 Tax=Melghirimyces thermohalophilus TaxID=1236220 RepID=A0A1G6L1V0_9BACL|nr:ABC transporter ATP-binding protein [Melghirimyces thermohalophilus]MDA8353783.1 ABC transporter ATP-binding protein [Bacillota bacterium]SDC37154.1 oligopeptide/dipeptide ABC transporter, ATP-binding protein, C-terminal domain-containing protein [Melghirimyces thermohalophilus]